VRLRHLKVNKQPDVGAPKGRGKDEIVKREDAKWALELGDEEEAVSVEDVAGHLIRERKQAQRDAHLQHRYPIHRAAVLRLEHQVVPAIAAHEIARDQQKQKAPEADDQQVPSNLAERQLHRQREVERGRRAEGR